MSCHPAVNVGRPGFTRFSWSSISVRTVVARPSEDGPRPNRIGLDVIGRENIANTRLENPGLAPLVGLTTVP